MIDLHAHSAYSDGSSSVADYVRAAKAAGFLVSTNTTVYKQTDPHETLVLAQYLAELGGFNEKVRKIIAAVEG